MIICLLGYVQHITITTKNLKIKHNENRNQDNQSKQLCVKPLNKNVTANHNGVEFVADDKVC